MSDVPTRQDRRFHAAIPVEVSVSGPAQVQALWTENISKGGLFVRSDKPLPVGTRLEIRLKGTEIDVTLQAQVAHVVDRMTAEQTGTVPGVGVRFLELHPEVEATLLAYIARLDARTATEIPSRSPPTATATATTSTTATTTASAVAASKAATASGDGWVLGIDLGTTNVAAFARGPGEEDGVSVLRGERGRGPVLPSIVSLKNLDRPLVGWAARDMMLTDPLSTIFGWKRFLGRPEHDEFVQRHRTRFPYRIRADERGELGAVVEDRTISFISIAALVLHEVRMSTRTIIERDVTDAVVAVPAHFSTAQRRSVIEAGRRAGLNVRKLVNEPTAAALALGSGRNLDTRMLVFDLGGGTFDASILEIVDDVFDVRMTSGESFLGGLDFDRAIAMRLMEVCANKHRLDLSEEPVIAQRVLNAAEHAKLRLSEAETADIRVPMVGHDSRGRPVDLEYRLSRAELEALTAPLVERCIGIVEDMLVRAQVEPKELEAVVLVGGQSRMPLVRRRLENVFGPKIHAHPYGDPAVAKGASIVGAGLDDLGGALLMDVLSVPLGIMVPGGHTAWLFAKGEKLPARQTVAIDVARPNEPTTVAIWEGTDLTSPDRRLLGLVRIPPELVRSGSFALEVQLSADLALLAQGRAGAQVVPLSVEAPPAGG